MKKILIAVAVAVATGGVAFAVTTEANSDIDAAQYRTMAMRSAVETDYRDAARIAMADGRVTRAEFLTLSRGRQPAGSVGAERALLAQVLAR